jgi:hypothetical protein
MPDRMNTLGDVTSINPPSATDPQHTDAVVNQSESTPKAAEITREQWTNMTPETWGNLRP